MGNLTGMGWPTASPGFICHGSFDRKTVPNEHSETIGIFMHERSLTVVCSLGAFISKGAIGGLQVGGSMGNISVHNSRFNSKSLYPHRLLQASTIQHHPLQDGFQLAHPQHVPKNTCTRLQAELWVTKM